MGVTCSSDRQVHPNSDAIPKAKLPAFKVVLVGQPQVGKSSVFYRYLKNQFDYSYRPTTNVVIESAVRKLNVPDNNIVAVTLWDLPGRDDVDLRRTYYKNVDAAIVVVDVSDHESVDMAATWRQEVVNNAMVTRTVHEKDENGQIKLRVIEKPVEPGKLPVLLMGNKLDVVEEQELKNKVKALSEQAEKEKVLDMIDRPFSEQKYSWDMEALPDSYRKNSAEPLAAEEKGTLLKPVNKEKCDDNESDQTEEKDDLPEAVRELHEIADKHGFIASFPVSAKANDGSVVEAMQSLIRLLLEKQQDRDAVKKEAMPIVKLHKKKLKKEKDPDKLEPIDVEEMDELYARCHLPMRMARNFSKSLKSSLKDLRVICVENSLVGKGESTLSHCMSAFKERTRAFDLKVEDDDHFISITLAGVEIYGKELDDVTAKVYDAIQQLFEVCRAIAREMPGARAFLGKLDTMLEERAEEVASQWQLDGKDENVMKQMGKAVEDHNARIESSIKQMDDRMSEVAVMKSRIKTALMW